MSEKEDLIGPAKSAASIIAISIGFAVLMIVVSHLMRGSEHRDTVMFCLIAAWWIPFTYFALPVGLRCEKDCRR